MKTSSSPMDRNHPLTPPYALRRDGGCWQLTFEGRQSAFKHELGAKLSSLKGIVWVGVGLFVFGLASLVWPPLKVVIGSVTTSAALMLGGVALMVLPNLVVGNELLILGVVRLAVGGWFLAHRHGQLQGIVTASNGAASPGTASSPKAGTVGSAQGGS